MIIEHVHSKDLVHRYMVVEYHAKLRHSISFDENGLFKNAMPIHGLLHSYHWAHLDTEHVLVTGYFTFNHQQHIENHHSVSVLPSMYSTKKLKTVMKKDKHWNAIKSHYALSDNAVMGDVLDTFAEKHGPVFAPSH